MTTIYRGLMGTQPRANLTAMRQRVQQRPVGMPRQPQATPAIQQPSGNGYDGSGINPGANLPRQQFNPRLGMPGQATPQNPGGIMPPHMQPQRPFNSPVVMPPQAGVPATPSGVPAAASMQAMPQRPQGMPPAPSGINPNVPPPITKRISLRSQGNAAQPIGATSAINPSVPGIETPDAARAPRLMGGP